MGFSFNPFSASRPLSNPIPTEMKKNIYKKKTQNRKDPFLNGSRARAPVEIWHMAYIAKPCRVSFIHNIINITWNLEEIINYLPAFSSWKKKSAVASADSALIVSELWRLCIFAFQVLLHFGPPLLSLCYNPWCFENAGVCNYLSLQL